ncbi:tripartite tricarboxylate transporter substrate binding protein [Pollutimonas bauzanensis]|uniref:Tripartite-type tricarboxylate transporter, receptor component TctC n=1 Tax=Pollutimonas bauzanensis TaxID=658167 RepID=A0A1M6AZU0_9BURK|nr:tripartite tricarboxylate transporter substrate binding protein [Pollutimonas bauzanensis]SHI41995.1 Tripartite-type tricarboxylate transporter, receptor component TctC [Pollutimonas bauzanensis]
MARPSKRILLLLAMLALGITGSKAGFAASNDWPNKPVRLIVTYPAGGGADIVARLVSAKMAQSLGQQIVVENRPGANGQIGASAVAHSAPDGYTILLDATGFAINPGLYKKLPYDSKNDFVPISLLVKFPNLLVKTPKFGAGSVQDLVKMAKEQPGQITYASSGIGSVQHLAAALFASQFKLDMLHVPYKGGSPAMTDLAGGQVKIMFANGASSLPFVKSGKAVALATTGSERSEALPEGPTMAEAGVPGFEVYEWNALFAPKGTSAEIIEKLSSAAHDAIGDAEVQKQLISMGGEPIGGSPSDSKAFIYGEMEHWTKVIEENNIEAQ